jgi:predicted PurR-regulated permease PerM
MTSPQRVIPPRDRFYARSFALVTTVVLGIALYYIVAPFMRPLLWALFIAFLVHPLHVRLSRRLRNRPHLSALLLTLSTFVVIIGPLTALSATFAAQVGDLLQFAQQTVADQTKSNVFNLTNVPWVRDGLGWLDETFGISLASVQGWLVQSSRELLQWFASMGGKVFIGAIGTVVNFLLMLFLLFFFIRDGAEMISTHKQKLFDHLGAVTRAMVYGTGMTAIIQGALVGVSFVIVGLPSPVVFGVVAALVALLPVGGSALVWAPAAIVLAIQGRWGAALFMLIWGALLVSLVDNFVRPMLVSGRAQVGTLTVFIGVLGGLSAFGGIGLFLGPVVLALIIALIRFMLEIRRAEKAAEIAASGP